MASLQPLLLLVLRDESRTSLAFFPTSLDLPEPAQTRLLLDHSNESCTSAGLLLLLLLLLTGRMGASVFQPLPHQSASNVAPAEAKVLMLPSSGFNGQRVSCHLFHFQTKCDTTH